MLPSEPAFFAADSVCELCSACESFPALARPTAVKGRGGGKQSRRATFANSRRPRIIQLFPPKGVTKGQQMRIDLRYSGTAALTSALALALTVSGCKTAPSAPDDATLTSQVAGRLSSDPNLSGQSVQATAASGVVTLNGSVTSDTARSIAAGDAAQIAGVRTVVNNLTVLAAAAAPPAATVDTAPPPPVRTEPAPRPSAALARRDRVQPQEQPQQPIQQPAPVVRNPPPPMQQAQVQPPPPPPPPPSPTVRRITLPAGTTIPVRITQTLDSATAQQGDRFSGAVASDIVQDGVVVLPQGTPVTGHVDTVQDAAHFKGSSLLTISLNSINRKGEHLEITTEPYTKEGEGRGKNTAEKVGGGAAVGAILGGILGGGKGAAIGSVAGGGVGAGAQAATRGQQVQIPSESIIRFRLTNELPVRVTSGGDDSGRDSAPALERR